MKDYTGATVSINQINAKNKLETISNLSYGHGTGDKINTLVSVAGASGNETITAFGSIETVTGGAGKDTFVIGTGAISRTVTITDYVANTDVVSLASGVKFADKYTLTNSSPTLADALTDYSHYYTYLGGDNATLHTNAGNIVLNGVATKKSGTGAITIGTTKIASLSNQEEITLTSKTTADTFDFSETKSFNGASGSKGVTFIASANFETFTGTSKNDKVVMTNAGAGKSVTLGAGDDAVTLGSQSDNYLYTGGKDTFNSATASNASIGLGANWSISSGSATLKEGQNFVTSATINVAGAKKATGSIVVNGTEGQKVFTITYGTNYTAGTKKGGTSTDSDSTLFVRDVLISGAGLSNIVVEQQTSKDYGTTGSESLFEDKYGVKSAGFEEQEFESAGFEELVGDYVEGNDLNEVMETNANISVADIKVETSEREVLKIAPTSSDRRNNSEFGMRNS